MIPLAISISRDFSPSRSLLPASGGSFEKASETLVSSEDAEDEEFLVVVEVVVEVTVESETEAGVGEENDENDDDVDGCGGKDSI